jgi:NAD(P)-dependent dehydrogenase (short-subunit alcohol dehydrogenase family)
VTTRRAVVTGAGPSSIGRAVADLLMARGWDVVTTTRATLDLTDRTSVAAFAARYAEQYGERGLRALSVHPGAVSTNIADRGLETRPVLRRLRNLALPLERRSLMSPAESARHLVQIATDPDAESGYYRKSRPTEPAPAATDVEARRRLREATEEWLSAR